MNRWISKSVCLGLLFALSVTGQAVAQQRGGRHAAAVEAPAEVGSAQQGVININTATADELQRLPGIGPSKAQAILATRQRMGRFARVEDVLRVRGIGRATLRRLQSMLRIEGATTLTAPAAHGRVASGHATVAQE